MSASGQATVNAVVPYLGQLFQSGKRPNMFLRMLGGLTGGVLEATSREFPVGVTYSLRAPSQPAILEGAAAPTAQHNALTQATNVIQIFHEKVSISYLAQGDKSIGGVVPIPQGAANGQVLNPRSTEFQVGLALDTIAQDANYSFLRGTYANPADPAGTALKTRGLLTSVTTNVVDQSATNASGTDPKGQYKGFIESLVQTVVEANGWSPDDTWTLFAAAKEFKNAQAAYETVANAPMVRNVAGYAIRTIVTRFGNLNLVLEPDMPAETLLLANMGIVNVVGLPVPGKGILFEEPLYKSGSSDETQIYGQMGIDHGPEFCHGKLVVKASQFDF